LQTSTGATLAFFRDEVDTVYNNTGSTITKGQFVYVNGANTSSPQVGLAKADAAGTASAYGVAIANILTGNFGTIQKAGSFTGVNTSTYSVGDGLWISAATAGAVTNVEPSSPNYGVFVGYVTAVGASGTINISMPGLVMSRNYGSFGTANIGALGTETNSIIVNGTTYNSVLKVSDIGDSNVAQTILHRHSTTFEPLIAGARSNSDTSSHGDVTNGQSLFTVYGLGFAGSDYKIFGSVSLSADATGTISNTSSPGRFSVNVTPNGSVNPVNAMYISNSGAAVFASTVTGTQLVSTISTGTAPFSVSSTTNVANLNASSLSGATFAAPGSIGSGTPGSGAFTTVTTTSPIAAAYGGTNNAYFQVSGPASTAKTYTFPNSSQTIAALDLADQTLSGGANVTAANLGTKSSGTTTVDCGTSPLQYLTNGGAFTLAAPANDGSCIVQVTNNGSAGTITFSGFSVGSNTGDALTTTNTSSFAISVWRINSKASYRIAAYQ
jgi:hypothetical protein